MFLSLEKRREFFLEIQNKLINVTRSVKLLGMTLEDELKLDKHVISACENLFRKVFAFQW